MRSIFSLTIRKNESFVAKFITINKQWYFLNFWQNIFDVSKCHMFLVTEWLSVTQVWPIILHSHLLYFANSCYTFRLCNLAALQKGNTIKCYHYNLSCFFSCCLLREVWWNVLFLCFPLFLVHVHADTLDMYSGVYSFRRIKPRDVYLDMETKEKGF